MDGVVSELIAARPDQVAEVMLDLRWEPCWIPAVKSIERASDHSAFVPGLRVRRRGNIFGPREWVLEVIESEPLRLVLRHVDGDFKGSEEIYEIAPADGGARASVRLPDIGFPAGLFYRWGYGRNLKRLKAIVERRRARAPSEGVPA